MAVFNEAVELPEECVFGRQDGAGCYGDVGVPEVNVVGKKVSRILTEPTYVLWNTWLEKKMAL